MTTDKISPSVSEVLVTPTSTCSQNRKAGAAKWTLFIPKHLTGDEFVQMMEEKKRQKEEEERMKEERKKDRVKKRKEREELKVQKEKERAEKKELAAKKRQDKEEEARRKRVEREQARQERERVRKEKEKERNEKRERKRIEREARNMKESINENVQQILCPKCGESEESSTMDWVACDTCGAWWHIECAGVSVTAQDLEHQSWHCISCM